MKKYTSIVMLLLLTLAGGITLVPGATAHAGLAALLFGFATAFSGVLDRLFPDAKKNGTEAIKNRFANTLTLVTACVAIAALLGDTVPVRFILIGIIAVFVAGTVAILTAPKKRNRAARRRRH